MSWDLVSINTIIFVIFAIVHIKLFGQFKKEFAGKLHEPRFPMHIPIPNFSKISIPEMISTAWHSDKPSVRFLLIIYIFSLLSFIVLFILTIMNKKP